MKKETARRLLGISLFTASAYGGSLGYQVGESIRTGSEEQLGELKAEKKELSDNIGVYGGTITKLTTAMSPGCLDSLQPFLPGGVWQSSDVPLIDFITSEACATELTSPVELVAASELVVAHMDRADVIDGEIGHAETDAEMNKYLGFWVGGLALALCAASSVQILRRKY